jgi:glutathione S-transferase
MKVAELYLELPARRMIGSVFSRAPAPEQLKAEVRATLERGVAAINALATFSPYALGAELTAADIYLRYALAIPKMIGPAQLDWDIVASIDGLADWDAMMADTDIARKIDADQAENTPEFMARLKQSG